MTARTVRGTVEFIWDDAGHMLVTMDPEDPADPHTFELGGPLRDRLAGSLEQGDRVEVDIEAVPHEVLDPDSGPSESLRAEVLDVRVVR